MKKLLITLCSGLLLIAYADEQTFHIQSPEQITIPQQISYQGKLTNLAGSPVRDSIYSVTFRLFTVSVAGTAFWNETQNVSTSNGLFNVMLGIFTPVPYMPATGECYLEMQINPNPPMTPRIRLTSSAYAFMARKADSANFVAGGSGLSGSGTQGRGARWSAPTILGNSAITDDGIGSIAIGGATNQNYRMILYSGRRYGILAQGDSTAITGYSNGSAGTGLMGITDGNLGIGVFGYSSGTNSYAVCGYNQNSRSTGVLGLGNNITQYMQPVSGAGGVFNGDSTGIYSRANVAMNRVRAGYFVLSDGTNSYYASVACAANGYFFKILGDGTVSTIKETREGKKILFAPEMPEAYFEDIGRGKLISGKVRIDLDPRFLDCIVVNDQYPLNVFIQLNDDCNGVYVKTDNTGFDVYELNQGVSNAKFTYRVIAKWKGYEELRFPDAPLDLEIQYHNINNR